MSAGMHCCTLADYILFGCTAGLLSRPPPPPPSSPTEARQKPPPPTKTTPTKAHPICDKSHPKIKISNRRFNYFIIFLCKNYNMVPFVMLVIIKL